MLTLFGGTSLVRDGRPLEIKSRKAQALLGFLALEAGSRAVSRERLCGLLWSESGEEKARASLRQALHELKSVIDPHCRLLQARRETVGLAGAWTTDVAEILARLQSGAIDARLLDHKAIASSLLPGCEDLDPAFRAWLMAHRQLVQDQLTRGLERFLREPGEVSERPREAAVALLNLDPAHEEACRHLMWDAATRGDIGGALKLYRRQWELLDEEFGTEPSPQTQALAVEIKSFTLAVRPTEAPWPAPAAVSEAPSIAVLPFSNMSGDPGQEHVTDGIVEEIIAALSRVRSFFVISRSSTFIYKDRAIDVRAVGQELGVRYVLEGSFRRSGDRLRIGAQLIEAITGSHVWSGRYDGEVTDIFDLQDRVAEAVVGAIEPTITLSEIERARRKRPDSLTAYDLAMRALPAIWSQDTATTEGGLLLAERAMELDSNYALPRAIAAWCHAQRLSYLRTKDVAEDRAKANTLAEEAARLDGNDPLVLTCAGAAYSITGEHALAQTLIDKALVLDPNSAWAWHRRGWLNVYVRQSDRAIQDFQRAMRLSPIDPLTFNLFIGIGAAHFERGEYEDAVDWIERGLREKPDAIWANRLLIASYFYAGRVEDAQQTFAVFHARIPDMTVAAFLKGTPWGHAVREKFGEAFRALGLPD